MEQVACPAPRRLDRHLAKARGRRCIQKRRPETLCPSERQPTEFYAALCAGRHGMRSKPVSCRRVARHPFSELTTKSRHQAFVDFGRARQQPLDLVDLARRLRLGLDRTRRLTARTNPITRMRTSVEDGWLESSRMSKVASSAKNSMMASRP